MSFKVKASYLMWGALFMVASLDLMLHLHKNLVMKPKICRSNESYDGSGNIIPKKVQCHVGKPCEYPEEVDFRIIVMTYNRDLSLMKILQSLERLELDGDTAALEIFIDRSKTGEIHVNTVHVAEAFIWSKGIKRVHIREKHAGIYGQWIDTWRAKPYSDEVALLLEDDLSVSPYTWRWLKAVNRQYKHNADCFGYTLQSERVIVSTTGNPFARPANDVTFLYQLVGSWGFSPIGSIWKEFQDWFHTVEKDRTFHPYVDGLRMTQWYKSFEKRHTADSMWTMWFIYYAKLNNLYGVYNNINHVTGSPNYSLCVHREEPGLHYKGKGRKGAEKLLLTSWSDKYVNFPTTVKRYNFNGKHN